MQLVEFEWSPYCGIQCFSLRNTEFTLFIPKSPLIKMEEKAGKRKLTQLGFTLKRRNQGIRKFFISALCLMVLVLPALHEFQDLIDWEILSSAPHFEQAHRHQLALNGPDTQQGLDTNISALRLLLSPSLFKRALQNSSPTLSIKPEALILRC